jgi:SAM-dependent methyltransferase
MSIMNLQRHLPPRARRVAKKALYYGRARGCPICGAAVRRFGAFGIEPRPNASCPICGSLERHRLVWLFLQRRTDLFNRRPKRFLHFAPEGFLAQRLQQVEGLRYLSADLLSANAMVRMNIGRLPIRDSFFDAVYCSHVLEHVCDDRAAMREVRRVVKNDGWVIFQVPISAERTLEDPSVTDPQARLRLFGQEDHVRRYGPDFVVRLGESGFAVQQICGADLVDARRRKQFALADESLFFCTRTT